MCEWIVQQNGRVVLEERERHRKLRNEKSM